MLEVLHLFPRTRWRKHNVDYLRYIRCVLIDYCLDIKVFISMLYNLEQSDTLRCTVVVQFMNLDCCLLLLN